MKARPTYKHFWWANDNPFTDVPWIVWRKMDTHLHSDGEKRQKRFEASVLKACTPGPFELRLGQFPDRHYIHGVLQ